MSFVLRVFFCLGGLRLPSSTSTRTTSGSELVAVGAVAAVVVVTAVELVEAVVVVEVAVVVVVGAVETALATSASAPRTPKNHLF